MFRAWGFPKSHTKWIYVTKIDHSVIELVRGLDDEPMTLVQSGYMSRMDCTVQLSVSLRFLQALHLYLGNHDALLLGAYLDSLGND